MAKSWCAANWSCTAIGATRPKPRALQGWLAAHRRYRPFDEKGRIRITDRKKDIIVNDKGDNISPAEDRGHADASARNRPGDGFRATSVPISSA
jgi:hypothetical protein